MTLAPAPTGGVRATAHRLLGGESQLLVLGSCDVPVFLTRSRVPGLRSLVLDPRRDLSPPLVPSERRPRRGTTAAVSPAGRERRIQIPPGGHRALDAGGAG